MLILKCFGAKISFSCHPYASVKIWAPWNLTLGDNSCLGPYVNCYNQGHIHIGKNVIISQFTYLCASTHDYKKNNFPLLIKPIYIGDQTWVAADAFIGPGVIIGSKCVIAARAVVTKQVFDHEVVGGNPAKKIDIKDE